MQADIPLLAHNAGPWIRPDGYMAEWNPKHPLASTSGEVLTHRRVLFDAIGPAEHLCHWCEQAVAWGAPKGDPALLTVDHLDEVKSNNERSNLVPSCQPCNVKRSPRRR